MSEGVVGMMLAGLTHGLLGVGLVASLIVLIWVVIGDLGRDVPAVAPTPTAP